MPEYLSPGVYIQEVSGGAKPIEAVSTSTACFIGFTEKALQEQIIDEVKVYADVRNKPILVTNWLQYRQAFGDLVSGIYTPQSVAGFFQNGGTRCYVLSIATVPAAQTILLSKDDKTYLTVKTKQSGFTPMRITIKAAETPVLGAPAQPEQKAPDATAAGDTSKVDPMKGDATKDATPKDTGHKDTRTKAISKADAPEDNESAPFHILVERQVKQESAKGKTAEPVWKELEDVRNIRLVREDGKVSVQYASGNPPKSIELLLAETEHKVALSDMLPRAQTQNLVMEQEPRAQIGIGNYEGDVVERTGLGALTEIDDISIICVPDLMVKPPNQKDAEFQKNIKAVQTKLIAHCQLMGDRVAILDSPPNMTPQDVKEWRLNTAGYDTSYAALYYPWIQIMDRATNQPTFIPPSGYIAGIWGRNDTKRGVHKAPANEVVQDAIGLAVNATQGEQDILNPNGVNCIRQFPGMGIRVWGARTLSYSDPEWRYLNVRRLFNMIEKSIQRSTMWAVFEPNDWRLWSKLRRDVNNFLMVLYSQGMLFGASASQAFRVQCDEQNNPSYTRDLGQLYIDVAIAPVKPAEFIIFRIRQWSGEESAEA